MVVIAVILVTAPLAVISRAAEAAGAEERQDSRVLLQQPETRRLTQKDDLNISV
jgi:hypothetical protein